MDKDEIKLGQILWIQDTHSSRCFKDQKSAIEFYKNAKLRQIAEYKNEIRNASDLILFPLKHPFILRKKL